MRIIPAAPLTNITTNVAENDAPTWIPNSTNGYAVGDKVVRNHHVFRSTSAANKSDPAVEANPYLWVDLGPTNAYNMFDKRAGSKWLSGTYTTNATKVEVTFTATQVVNAISLFGLVGSTVQVTMNDPKEGEVYNPGPISIADTEVDDWYEYFFAPITQTESVNLFDLPSYGNATFKVVVSSPSGVAQIGAVVAGAATQIGTAVYGTSFGFQSYSTTDEDSFGNETIISRGSRDEVEYEVRVKTKDNAWVRRLIKSIKDVPSVFVGSTMHEVTSAYGRPDGFRANIANYAYSEHTLTVRSL